jgi:hypothetical protein
MYRVVAIARAWNWNAAAACSKLQLSVRAVHEPAARNIEAVAVRLENIEVSSRISNIDMKLKLECSTQQ